MAEKRIDPRTVDREELIKKDRVGYLKFLEKRLEGTIEYYCALRTPKRPLIAVDSDKSPLNTNFSGLFTKAREITAACEAHLKDENKSYMDDGYTKLTKAFVEVAKEIKEKSASPEEATVALAELFNYLTKHENSNAECGFRLSCDLVNEILSIPDADLDLVDKILLSYVPNEIAADWGPLELIGGDALARLEAKYVQDSKSGDKERVEKARAWAEIFESEKIQ